MQVDSSTIGILISQEVAHTSGAALLEQCKQNGLKVDLILHDRTQTPSTEALQKIRWALLSVDVIGKSTKSLHEAELQTFINTLQAAPHLQWLQVPSAGMDRPFYGDLYDQGVRLTSSAGANAKAVAQSAIAGILALSRCVPLWIDAQRQHRWHPLRGELIPPQLDGQHAVVVGMGAIGLDIGRILHALELQVTGVRRSPAPQQYFDQVVGFEALDTVLASADWLVLACPLTDITRKLLDHRRLQAMRPTARIVNVARGEIIDEDALISALCEQSIAGAYLDVFVTEPLPADSPLWDMPQVMISAHSAGNSTGHQRNVVKQFKENIVRLVRNEPLHNEWKPRA